MGPWWLRPTADDAAAGATEDVAGDLAFEPAEEEADGPFAEFDHLAAEAPEPTAAGNGEPESRGTRRRRRSRSRGRKVAARQEGPAENGGGEPSDEPVEEPPVESDPGPVATEKPAALVATLPDHAAGGDERRIALFCDLENVALGVRESEIQNFDILLVLERLLDKGRIIVKKAYADWQRYSEFKRTFHEAGIELIDIPQKSDSGKNGADVKMTVDAMELCYAKEHLDTFVVLSGDSDFSPLVSKLKENGKYVIGVGVKNSSSRILVDNCDEFIYYEDVRRDERKAPRLDGLSTKQAEAFGLMVDAIQALTRENKEVLWGSMVKQTMQRKRPSFNEGYHGYSSFSELLEDAERHQVIRLKKDPRSGSYIVSGFAGG